MADPVTIAVATALVTDAASKAAEFATDAAAEALKALKRAVFRYFHSVPEAQEALDEARIEPGDEAVAAVAGHLDRAAGQDPEIGRLMETLRAEVVQEGDGAVHNSIEGDISGGAKIIQGRDIHGSVHL